MASPEEEEEDYGAIDLLDGDVEVLDDLEGQGPPGDEDDEDDELDVDEPAGPSEDASIHTFEGHQDSVLAVAWNGAQRDQVATAGQDDRAFLWRVGHDAYEATAGTLSTFELAGHTDSVVGVAFNATGALLATGGMDGVVKIWSTADGRLLQTLEGPGGAVEWVRWHPRGDVVLAGAEDFTVWMWNAQTGACMQVFSGHCGVVTCGGFTPDGKYVVTGGGEGDHTLRVWNPKSGECSTVQGHPFHTAGLTCMSIHHDSSVAITGAEDGSVRITNVTNARVVGQLDAAGQLDVRGHGDSVEAVGFSGQLPWAASAGVDGKLLVWDCTSFAQRGACQHPDVVTRMAWHPSAPLVATACLDAVVRVWDLRSHSCVRAFEGHQAGVQDVCFSPDGAFLLSGADDTTARVFELAA